MFSAVTRKTLTMLAVMTVSPAAVALLVSDDFERADLGSDWQVIFGGNSPDIINDSVLGLRNSSANFGLVAWSASSLPPDQYSEAVIASGKSPDMLTQVFVRRRNTDGARYGFHYAGDPRQTSVFGKWQIKYDGVPTAQTRSLATADISSLPAPGDTLRVEVRGFTITGYHNGVEVISVTDTDTVNRIASGQPGLAYRWADDNVARVYPAPVWESWSAGNLDSGGTTMSGDIAVVDPAGNELGQTLSFGEVSTETPASKAVILRNDGNADLIIGQIAFNDPLAMPFLIRRDDCTAAVLAVNGRCTLLLDFLPSSTNSYRDSFDIPSNDPDENPRVLNVSGSGMTAGNITSGSTASSGGAMGWSVLLSAVLFFCRRSQRRAACA